MLVIQQDKASSDELFARIESRLREEGRWQIAPTALLRLKGAIRAIADADVCLAALEDLRSAFSLQVAARDDLSQRCRLLEAALRDLEVAGPDAGAKAHVADTLESASGRRQSGHCAAFAERLAHVFGTRVAPTSLAILRIGIGSLEELDRSQAGAADSQLLDIAATRIARAVRSVDIVTRLDKDEFACVLLDLPSREQLTHLACKVLDRLSEPVQVGECRVRLRPSIGIAMCPDDGDTPDELLRIAGAAMQRAGDHGNGYAFSDARAERWAIQFSSLC